MYAKPAFINLVVIRSTDLSRAEAFYNVLGIFFEKEAHGSGPEHLCGGAYGALLEIYPLAPNQRPTTSVRIGFSVDNVDADIERLTKLGIDVVKQPHDTKWGRRAVVRDPEGHTIELVTPQGRDASFSDAES